MSDTAIHLLFTLGMRIKYDLRIRRSPPTPTEDLLGISPLDFKKQGKSFTYLILM